MNREIKFRAWNTAIKKMYEVGQITMGKGVWDYNKVDEEIGVCIPYQPSLVLMQYTGLKDKNGVEIYEGDIVKAIISGEEESEIIGQVTYCSGCASYIVICKNDDEYGLSWIDNLEVIGNVFENGDLLKECEE